MADTLGSVLQILLASLGLVSEMQPGTATIAAAVAVAAALLVALVLAIAPSRSPRTSLARPRRAIDVSATLSQSDPDAAGHPRSRAPGLAAAAA